MDLARTSLIAATVLGLVSQVAQAVEPVVQEPAEGNAHQLVIWAHSDIQPRNDKELKQYARAVADMRSAVGRIDMAVLAGDMVQYRDSAEQYNWLLRTRRELPIPFWFEIAGNHEARNYKNYFAYIKKPMHYSVEVGNLLLIFMSDEINSSPTEISDLTFAWWRDLVIDNQDKIIITIAHAYLAQSQLFAHKLYRSKILRSGRFARVLEKYRVSIWLAGHTTNFPGIGRGESIIQGLNGTLFLNVSSIREDFGINSKSRLIVFEDGSQIAAVKLRDHRERSFIEDREIRLPLPHPFVYDGKPPRMTPMPGTLMPGPLSPASE